MPKAKPNTPAAAPAPAPEKTQEPAGAGETQDETVLSGANGPDPVVGLRITAAREGFRRCGRAWSKRPTEIPVAGLSEAEVAALMAEPMLTVEEITLP